MSVLSLRWSFSCYQNSLCYLLKICSKCDIFPTSWSVCILITREFGVRCSLFDKLQDGCFKIWQCFEQGSLIYASGGTFFLHHRPDRTLLETVAFWALCSDLHFISGYIWTPNTLNKVQRLLKKTSFITILDWWTFVNFKYSSYKKKGGISVVPVRALNGRKVVKSPNNE